MQNINPKSLNLSSVSSKIQGNDSNHSTII
nr:MAG TPA: hypothetical protein [Caudoviricetes sp.]